MPRQCLQISRANGESLDPLEYSNRVGDAVLEAKLASMSIDEWSVFIFLRGLDAPGDNPATAYLMQFCETAEKKGEKLKLSDVHDEWIRFIQMKQQTRVVSALPVKPTPQQAVEVNKVDPRTPKKKRVYCIIE